MTIANRGELADSLGLTPEEVSALSAAGMPSAGEDRFDVAECALWRIQQLIVHGHPAGDPVAEREIGRLRKLVTGERLFEMATSGWIENLVPRGTEFVAREFIDELYRRLDEKLASVPERYAARLIGSSTLEEAEQRLADVALAIMRDLGETRAEMEVDGWTAGDGAP